MCSLPLLEEADTSVSSSSHSMGWVDGLAGRKGLHVVWVEGTRQGRKGVVRCQGRRTDSMRVWWVGGWVGENDTQTETKKEEGGGVDGSRRERKGNAMGKRKERTHGWAPITSTSRVHLIVCVLCFVFSSFSFLLLLSSSFPFSFSCRRGFAFSCFLLLSLLGFFFFGRTNVGADVTVLDLWVGGWVGWVNGWAGRYFD